MEDDGVNDSAFSAPQQWGALQTLLSDGSSHPLPCRWNGAISLPLHGYSTIDSFLAPINPEIAVDFGQLPASIDLSTGPGFVDIGIWPSHITAVSPPISWPSPADAGCGMILEDSMMFSMENKPQTLPRQSIGQVDTNPALRNLPSNPKSTSDIIQHEQEADSEELASNHGYIDAGLSVMCYECRSVFPSKVSLDTHARETHHTPYICKCQKKFSRLDCLKRHVQKFQPPELFPCEFCNKHRGKKAFKRRDHLTQHLRGRHNFEAPLGSDNSWEPIKAPRRARKTITCPHETCTMPISASGTGISTNKPFQTQADLTKHMRQIHELSPFPCAGPGCNRVGKKGFFRERDLIKHQMEHHTIQANTLIGEDR